MLGDFNIDLSKPATITTKLNQFYHNNLLSQLVKSPTRITNIGQTLIDHIVTNNDSFYNTSSVVDLGWSDHCMVYVTRKRLKAKRTVSYFVGRSYRNFNEVNFRADMYHVNWLPLYCINDINDGVNFFNHTLKSVMNIHAPFKRIKSHTNQAQWVTGEFLSLVDTKHHFCNVYRRRPTVHNAIRRREAIARVKYMKKALKRDYVREALHNCEGDSKRTWRMIKSLWPTKSKQTTIHMLNNLTNETEIANELNSHFCNIGPTLSKSITPTGPCDSINNTGTSFDLRPITMDEIVKVLAELSPSKACGLDGITARLVKACGDTILPPLHYLFNLSLSTLTFPDQWKSAIVTPLFKAGSTSDPNNYRPISVLPVISKLLERLIHNQMSEYLTSNNLLSPNQYKFRKGYSTGTCLIDFLDGIYDNIEHARPSGVSLHELVLVGGEQIIGG